MTVATFSDQVAAMKKIHWFGLLFGLVVVFLLAYSIASQVKEGHQPGCNHGPVSDLIGPDGRIRTSTSALTSSTATSAWIRTDPRWAIVY